MKLTHINKRGESKMVSIKNKKITNRKSIAYGKIKVNSKLLDLIKSNSVPKGEVLNTARVAGILAAKRTSLLIPMCHSLLIENIKVDFIINSKKSIIETICTIETNWKTGVEIEALTCVSIVLLTIYDMCKAIDKNMEIEKIKLLKKTGGKSDIYSK